MDALGGDPELTVLGKRIEFLELLDGEPMHKRDVEEHLEHSRSTVDRAIGALVDAGFVERVTRGFVTTQTGCLAARRYRTFLAETEAVLDARTLLEPLPPDAAIPSSLLTAGECVQIQGSYRLLETIADALDGATGYRVAVPQMVDSRHIRLCHARSLRDDLDVSMVAPVETWDRIRTEFPVVTADLTETPSFDARVGEAPAYGIVLVERPAETVVVLVTYEGAAVNGFVRSTASEVVEWARSKFAHLSEAASPLSGTFDDESATSTLSSLLGDRLPPALREQGFVCVDDRYADDRAPLSPTVSYRAGLGLPEVLADQSVDRFDDAEQSLTESVLDRLRAGADLAVIGPPGSGKSTLCKRVAAAWYRRDVGSVFYRERATADAFEATTSLERTIDRARGPVLVVVEDAVRREANAIFELVQRFADRDDVVFLLDAREAEWHAPLDGAADARIEATRQSAVETVSMPPLDESECRSLVARLSATADIDVEVSAGDLLGDATGSPRGGRTDPAAIYLVAHRLARYADPLAAYEETPTPTTLEDDVARVHDRLDELGSDAMDVGVLIALLEAAGCPIDTASLESLAVAGVVDTDVPGRVREALTGVALFPTEDGYRGPHESWSARFLEQHLDTVGDAAAHQRVERVLSAYLSLADDPYRRAELAERCGGETRLLDRIVRDPTGWADETVARLYGVGTSYASLAPLFGRGTTTAFPAPDACSPGIERRCLIARGRMFETAGDLDAAESAYRQLETLSSDADTCVQVDRHLGLATIERRRGNFEAASEHVTSALDRLADRGETERTVRCHLERASIATDQGALDRATEALAAGRSALESIDAPRLSAQLLTRRGVVERTRSNYEEARRLFEESLDYYESVSDREGVATVRGYLGQIANERGDLDAAHEQFLRGLEQARDGGAVAAEADLLKNLGVLAYLRDDYEEAERYFEQGKPLAEAISEPSVLLPLELNGGLIDVERQDYEAARERIERALALARDIGASRYEGAALRSLTLVALETDDPSRASEYARETLTVAREVGATRMEIDALQFLASALVHQGAFETARERAATAVETAREIDNDRKVAETLVDLARAERRLGDVEAASDHARESRTIHAEAGSAGEAASRRVLAGIYLDRDELETAREHARCAAELYREDGNDRSHGLALALLARIHRECGDLDRARARVEAAFESARSSTLPAVRALTERAAIERLEGQLSAARATLETARETLPDDQFPVEACRLDVESARLAAARGDYEAARDTIDRAVSRYEDLGADHLAAAVRAEREALDPEADTVERPRRLRED